MMDDPIVEEIHQIRAKLLAEYGGNLSRYLESLGKRCSREVKEEPIRDIKELRRKTMKEVS